jgi:hypothetical protein
MQWSGGSRGMSVRLLDKDEYFQLLASSTAQRVLCGEAAFDA